MVKDFGEEDYSEYLRVAALGHYGVGKAADLLDVEASDIAGRKQDELTDQITDSIVSRKTSADLLLTAYFLGTFSPTKLSRY